MGGLRNTAHPTIWIRFAALRYAPCPALAFRALRYASCRGNDKVRFPQQLLVNRFGWAFGGEGVISGGNAKYGSIIFGSEKFDAVGLGGGE